MGSTSRAEYAKYSVRLNSFRTWPGRRWNDIRELAKAGLYMGQDNMLRCAFCELVLADWRVDDNAWVTHAVFVPFCLHLLFMKGIVFVRSVLEQDGSNAEGFNSTFDRDVPLNCRYHHSGLTIRGICAELHRKQNSSSSSPSYHAGSARVYKTPRGVQFRQPVNVQMANPDDRLRSFSTMHEQYRHFLDIQTMVGAGFFYTGEADTVRCYYCGGGFRDWTRTDDPWIEHARLEPGCMHVILTKGEEFVNMLLGGDTAHRPLRNHVTTERDAGKRSLEFEQEDDTQNAERKKKHKTDGVDEKSDRRVSENPVATNFPDVNDRTETGFCDRCHRTVLLCEMICSLRSRTTVCKGCVDSEQQHA